jgi:hypothetical protein
MEPMLRGQPARHDVHGHRDRQGPLRAARRAHRHRATTRCCAAATTAARGSGSRCPAASTHPRAFPYIDPVTDRLFVTSFSADLTRCGQPVIYSDDEGEHWTSRSRRPGLLAADARRLAEDLRGPAPARRRRLPDAVYVCNFIPNILVAASIGCWRSDDGGDHFEFTASCRRSTALCKAGDVQGGTGPRSSTAAAACSPTALSSSR